MARVTSEEVQAIMKDYDSAIDLDAFITAANLLITGVCNDSGYSAAELKEIERWYSAHLYCINDPQLAEAEAGNGKSKYQYKVDLAINQTRYGQMAMTLDYKGNLSQLNKRIVDGEQSSISINWMGEDYDSEEDDD